MFQQRCVPPPVHFAAVALLSLLMAGCAGGRFDTPFASGHYESHAVQCVPYARQVSGVQLYGDAYTWWNQVAPDPAQPILTAPRYAYGMLPIPGSVLVLAQTPRMTHGHLAVVKDVIDPRTINVTQSNWGSDSKTRRIIYESQRAMDVSDLNDWSQVRFWNKDAEQFGFPYAAKGFIYRTASQQQMPDFTTVLSQTLADNNSDDTPHDMAH